MPSEQIAFDKAASVRSYDGDGRLHVARTHISKANVCEYLGAEIPDFESLGLQRDKLYKLWRHPEELKKATETFNNLPLLSRHVPVDANDHRPELVIGSLGTDAEFNDPYLDNSLIVWAGEGISDIENELKKELSSAYRYLADMTPGRTPDGEEYDGVMRDIAGNHVALVKEGRAGPEVMVGDSMENITMAKVKMTRTGAAVRSVIALHIGPRLAQDARLDLRPILAKLTTKNFAGQKAPILAAIKTAAKGKLAKDASLDDVTGLLDSLEKAQIDKGDEDIDVGDLEEESMDAEPEPGGIHEFLKGKLGEDDYRKACDMLKAGHASDEEDEEEKKRKETEAEEKMAGDIEEAVKEKTKDMVDKKAMDAAIDAATKTERRRQHEIADAREEVRPMVGSLKQAFDSAEGVYQAALTVLGVVDADKITGIPALKAVLGAQRQAAQPRRPIVPAMDAAAAKGISERFPHAAKIKVSA